MMIGSAVLSGLAVALGNSGRRYEEVAVAILALGVVMLILGSIVFMMTLHALWVSIQPPPRGAGVAGIARTTPGMAVGMLFVPVYNYYWVFQAWRGWARDCNATIAARGIVGAPPAPQGLATAIGVLAIVGIVPFVGFAAALTNMILLPIFLSKAVASANAVRAAGIAA